MTDCLAETALRLLAQQQEIEVLKSRLVALGSSTELYDLFISVPGIGPYLASSLIAELKDIRRFENHKKLIAYCGFDPTIIQSGKSIHYNGPISKRGNSTATRFPSYWLLPEKRTDRCHCCSITKRSVVKVNITTLT